MIRIKGVVLAGGLGKRLGGEVPKPLVGLLGKPLIGWVIESMQKAGVEDITLVVSPAIFEEIRRNFADFDVLIQERPLGTAHAAATAISRFGSDEDVLVMYSDTPLFRPETIRCLMGEHEGDATFLTHVTSEKFPYAVVVRKGEKLVGLKEHLTANGRVEYSVGVYVFRVGSYMEFWKKLKPNPRSGEYYISDLIDSMISGGLSVKAVSCAPEDEFLGVNTPNDLKRAEEILKRRGMLKFARGGAEDEDTQRDETDG